MRNAETLTLDRLLEMNVRFARGVTSAKSSKSTGPAHMAANLQEVAAMLEQSRTTPFLFSGMVIRESPICTRPRMTLSPKLAAIIGYSKPEFVKEMNDWMLNFFGAEDHVYFFTDPVTGRKTCVMSPRAAAQLRRGTPK